MMRTIFSRRPRRRFRQLLPVLIAAALCAGVLLTGCTVKQTVLINRDGSGTADINIQLHPVLESYMRDLISLSDDVPADVPIFDPAAIERTFRRIPDLELIHAETPSPAELTASVRFNDIAAVFTGELPDGVRSPAVFRSDGASKEVIFYLDYQNYIHLMARFLSLAALEDYQGYVTALLEPGPEEVIFDMYEYAFEDYLREGQSVQEVLKKSTIELTVRTAGEIIAQTGGEIRGGAAVFTIPLLEILTMDGPFTYTILFR